MVAIRVITLWTALMAVAEATCAQPLLPTEKAAALRLEETAVQQQRARASSRGAVAAAIPDQLVGVRLLPASEAPAPKRIAELIRYQYAGGITYHTYVDVTANQVLSVTPLQNHPTPLSDEEVVRAAQVAREQVPQLAGLLDAHAGQTTATIHGVQVADPDNPEYGQRVVLVRHRGTGSALIEIPPVTVNLTTGRARIE